MKKIKLIALLMAIMMTVTLFACGRGKDNDAPTDGDLGPGDVQNPGGDTSSGDTPGSDTPGGDVPSGDTPGGDTPGGDAPGADSPGGDAPATPDAPASQWPDNVAVTGYTGVSLIHKGANGTIKVSLDSKGADKIAYIATLIDPQQSNGPKSYSDYVPVSAAFEGSSDNYGIDFIFVRHNGNKYIAVKLDKENVEWLKAEAVQYFEQTVTSSPIGDLIK